MANWLGVKEVACQYGIEVGEILLWQRIEEISFAKVGDTLMVDKESIEIYMLSHAVWSDKARLRELLFDQEDELINKLTGSYDNRAFYARLQDECYELCPVVIDALAELISDETKQNIFRSIIKGEKLAYVAEKNGFDIESILELFHQTVINLREGEIKLLSDQVELCEQIKLARNAYALEAIWRKECYDAILEKYNELQKKMAHAPLDPDMIFPREPNKGSYNPETATAASTPTTTKTKGFFHRLSRRYPNLFGKGIKV